MSLHQKITEARKNKGFTQEELADRASVTVRTIQRMESGDTVPRNFTLKAIAQALDIPFEEILPKNNNSLSADQKADKETDIHFLKLLNLSSFAYLVLPYAHFLIPMYLLKKKAKDAKVLMIGRKIIRTQIYWLIAIHLVFFLTLAYNLGIAHSWNNHYVNYLWPFFIMYFVNAIIIGVTHFRIKTNYSSPAGHLI